MITISFSADMCAPARPASIIEIQLAGFEFQEPRWTCLRHDPSRCA
jgi:hypothetical protein